MSLEDKERIVQILEDVIQELEYISFLPTQFSQLPPDLFQYFPSSTQQLLSALFEEEKKFNEFWRDERFAEAQDYFEKLKSLIQRVIEDGIKHNITATVRKYLESTDKNLQKYASENNKLQQNTNLITLRKMMLQLKELWAEKLTTTVEEDQIREDQKNEIAAREKKARADLKALQREFAAEKTMRDKEVSLREDSLNKLKDELLKLKNSSKNERDEFDHFLKGKEQEALYQYNRVNDKLAQLKEQNTNELLKLQKDHTHKEKEDMTKRKGTERNIENSIAKYDQVLTETTEALKHLNHDYDEDQKKVDLLKAEIHEMEEQKKLREELLEAKELAREKKMELHAKKWICARRIQKHWKKHLLWKEQEKKNKKKGKGKQAPVPPVATGSGTNSKPITPKSSKPSTPAPNSAK